MSLASRAVFAICPTIAALGVARQQKSCQQRHGAHPADMGSACGRFSHLPARCEAGTQIPSVSISAALHNYEFGRRLGKGAGGVVFRAKHRETGKLYAIKRCLRAQGAVGPVEREVRALAALDHPHVVGLFEHFSDACWTYLVEELCTGPDLLSFIQQHPTKLDDIPYVPEREAAAVFRQCLEAVAGVHAQGFVHRDVKADNFVLAGPREAPHVKLVDFGLADKAAGESLKGRNLGTASWMAPEMIFGEEHTAAVDVWSLGALLFTLLTGESLVHHKSESMARHCLRDPTFSQRRVRSAEALRRLNISEDALDLLERLLEHNPSKRIAAADALGHPFFRGCDRE